MAAFLTYVATWLPGIQIVLGVLLIICILLQNRGAGMGAAFGGTSTIYRTKRGIEKGLFRLSVTLAILFAAVSLARIIL